MKTGFTSGAGYCLSASAQRDGMELIAVVMGCETSQDRFAACKSMLDYGFANFALITPQLEATPTVPVKLGSVKEVTAVPGEEAALLIDKAQKGLISTELTLEETVTAPVSRGQKLGTMTIKAGEQVLAQIPMVASDAVPKLTFWQIFRQVLRRAAMAKEVQ